MFIRSKLSQYRRQVVTKQASQRSESKMLIRQLITKSRHLSLVYLILLTVTCASILLADRALADEVATTLQDKNNVEDSSIPVNHRMEGDENLSPSKPVLKANSRQSRQYDTPISASGSGSYASISGDGAAYVGQMPISSTNYVGSSSNPSLGATNYVNDLSGAYQSAAYDPISMVRASYPTSPMAASGLHHPAGYPSSFGAGVGPLSSMFASTMGAGGGSMFPLMGKGFDLSEIVCTAIAVAIGAVIIGAPFILIYLFVMNQMNGNGPSLGQNGGAISLTGPTSSTTVSGRKKRHTSLPEALFKHLSPLVNSEQVSDTFKALMKSISKYQM